MQEFSEKLLAWFDVYGRHDLPWQQNKTAYRVWVSEIMLQQTQVKTVIPYYERFMQSFPTLQQLADASQEEVLAHWSGLGYYARGRNLHKAAQLIQQEYGGEFPDEFDEIVSLPGIGRSTAGAILSIAHKKRYPILDGNVKRVLSRYLAVEGWPGEKPIENKMWEQADLFTPERRFDDYTQAIMDLGATLCTRSKPGCDACPLASDCAALKQDRVANFPFSKPKKTKPVKQASLLMLLNERNQIWLEQRPQNGIWGGLWSLPQYGSLEELEQALKPALQSHAGGGQSLVKWESFRHTFSHYHLDIEPVSVGEVQEAPAGWCGEWYNLTQTNELGLPAPVKSLLGQLEKEYVKNGQMRKNG
ncbi:A/G-specific adenine glycosylase [Thiomicrorhabdus sp. ZW0627]|uniref:A/G-specific adenine glycosylase n=1 Tax=Thiomicrorhabdus sp. ZW0627 TaxID=3039774 RepID=UPI0024372C0C|nr:A/G-specific adenine glycosylase [Thiomicrorhabdus sp. ZW0627]MDG6774360.1 A/G-specific adenine glycosylase [Thiomicrorhabdus sp. ZW0627]